MRINLSKALLGIHAKWQSQLGHLNQREICLATVHGQAKRKPAKRESAQNGKVENVYVVANS